MKLSYLRSLVKTASFIVAVSVILFLAPQLIVAQMQSPNYRIQTDSVNVGGAASGSANYNLEDTLGEVATGLSESDNYRMAAGFWQMQQSFISITPAGNVAMTPNINGLTGGVGNGSASWTVITDNLAGYELYIRALDNPAMHDGMGRNFPNYTPDLADPDYEWVVPSTTAAFGYTVEGVDTAMRFRDNGTFCGTGGTSISVDKCWDGIITSNAVVSQRASSNHPSGTTTTVKFRAESGNQNLQINSVYSADIVVTALPL